MANAKFLFRFVQAPQRFEEFIAGAYEQAGYNVILTPQRGDLGRDIIASKDGFGSVHGKGSFQSVTNGKLPFFPTSIQS